MCDLRKVTRLVCDYQPFATKQRWTQTSFPRAWHPPCDPPDQPEDSDSETFMRSLSDSEAFMRSLSPDSLLVGRAVSRAKHGACCQRWPSDQHKCGIRTGRHEVPSPQLCPLLSLSNTAGLCACGRSACARKTNDSTLVEAKQRITRGRQLRRAKMQSSLILPECSNYNAYAASTVDTAGTPLLYSAHGTRGEDYESEAENAALAERDTRLNRFHRF